MVVVFGGKLIVTTPSDFLISVCVHLVHCPCGCVPVRLGDEPVEFPNRFQLHCEVLLVLAGIYSVRGMLCESSCTGSLEFPNRFQFQRTFAC